MWFNQPYIAKMYMDGTTVRATGRVSGSAGKLYLANPQLEKVSATEGELFIPRGNSSEKVIDIAETPKLFAVYPESRGVTSLWLRHAIEKVL